MVEYFLAAFTGLNRFVSSLIDLRTQAGSANAGTDALTDAGTDNAGTDNAGTDAPANAADAEADARTKPRNPRHFDTIEGRRISVRNNSIDTI